MPRAIFDRKPESLKQLIADTAELASTFHSRGTEYYVAEERELSEIEWRKFTARLLDDQPWIEAFSERDLPCGNPTACIRVTSPCAKIALIIDPQGYSYARYVAIERNADQL